MTRHQTAKTNGRIQSAKLRPNQPAMPASNAYLGIKVN